ncbi:MAG: alanine--glyoxylate aminotransferase family protein [Deltaproteobacteria bacterium]|nr:alanine--glyoxylate aminotransferase family protein [Deltaproteobacteria bacterium]
MTSVENNPYHRTDFFYSLISNCHDFLKPFFGTSGTPLILTSSGTGAMEAAMVNLTDPEDKVLMIHAGRFGERWAEMAMSYGCQTVRLDIPWGQVPDPDDLVKVLAKEKAFKAVFFHGVETSTGVYFPVAELTKVIRANSDALVVVDAVSSLVCHEMNMDDWGVDCVVAASQKGFGTAPGLSFISLSERAWQRLSKRPRFYFDLRTEKKEQSEGKTAWTPGTQLVLSLHSSLQTLLAIGRPNLYDFHARITEGVRAALRAMGLELYVPQDYAHSVTPFKVPQSIRAGDLNKELVNKYNMIFAGGQNQLQGKVLRIAHIGFVDPFDIHAALAGLELSLKTHGIDVVGKGSGEFLRSAAFA